MVREFQSGESDARRVHRIVELAGRLPDAIVACVGGGKQRNGMFDAFIDDREVRLIARAGGSDRLGMRPVLPAAARHAASSDLIFIEAQVRSSRGGLRVLRRGPIVASVSRPSRVRSSNPSDRIASAGMVAVASESGVQHAGAAA